jgi:tRNA (guanine37-N1)-methyltransferase
MMKIKIVTLFPDLVRSYLSDALISKAISAGIVEIKTINLRDFSDNKYKSVDDTPFGGGDGMLIRADILEKGLLAAKEGSKNPMVIYFSPQGKVLNHHDVQLYANKAEEVEYILICGRYAGVDQRFLDTYVDREVSIGDYILSGGELAALVFTEAVSRFVPGVLGKLESSHEDSFKNGLLEAPQYTRPQIWNNLKVPDVLTSGNHAKIAVWKEEMALKVTEEKRPDLLVKRASSPGNKK